MSEKKVSAGEIHREVFKRGSKTFFNSSLFFPKRIRDEVTVLYAFVRVADDFVDSEPQDVEGFQNFRREYEACLKGTPSENPIIQSFVDLIGIRDFDPQWVTAFLDSMAMDMDRQVYRNQDEILQYIYGSAEVIGLFMSRILGLSKKSDNAAMMQGRAMQYINFIRDIKEDNALNRQYLPLVETELETLREDEVLSKPQAFRDFHQRQVKIYENWQRQAEEGYRFIPRRYLIPIKTAADCYLWTAKQIAKNPMVVFQRKVKPNKAFILFTSLKNSLFPRIVWTLKKSA